MKRIKLISVVLSIPLAVMAEFTGRRGDMGDMGDSITDGAWGNSGGSSKPSEQRTHWDHNHIQGHGYMNFRASQTAAHRRMADLWIEQVSPLLNQLD